LTSSTPDNGYERATSAEVIIFLGFLLKVAAILPSWLYIGKAKVFVKILIKLSNSSFPTGLTF
jgi:hypothetical protein